MSKKFALFTSGLFHTVGLVVGETPKEIRIYRGLDQKEYEARLSKCDTDKDKQRLIERIQKGDILLLTDDFGELKAKSTELSELSEKIKELQRQYYAKKRDFREEHEKDYPIK